MKNNMYSSIRGVCYNPKHEKSDEQLNFELSCAKRLNINSIRFWLNQEEWEKNPKEYLKYIKNFFNVCSKYDMTLMPIIWNGNFISNFTYPSDSEWEKIKRYANDIIINLRNEPNLLMWDVINEPMWNDYILKSPVKEQSKRFESLTKYTRSLCQIVREFDIQTPITVGHQQANHCKTTVDLVDVISFHDYSNTLHSIEDSVLDVENLSKRYGNKPIINSETGCIGRANPYDIEIQSCDQHNIGFYLFCLVIDGFWGDIHGIIYPDGTIRDPSIVAALLGFYRNRSSNRVLPNPNKEGHAYKALNSVKEVLKVEPTSLFMSKLKTTDELLDAAEYCVNILEACELIPMNSLPSSKIAAWREKETLKDDILEIKKFTFDMAEQLKKYCLII